MNTLLLFLALTLPIDSLLQQLDYAVTNRQVYIDQRLAHVDSLKALPFTDDVAEQIYNAYDGFDTDSALLYAQLCAPQLAQINYAKCLATNGMYEPAKQILLPMEPHLLPENRNIYYKNLCLTYIWEAEFSTIESEKDQARALIPSIRDSLIATSADPLWSAQDRALRMMDNNPDSSITMLITIIDTIPIGSDMIRYLCNTIGSCYLHQNKEDEALYYFAQSALCDLQHGVMEHGSLREVAKILLQRGDIPHAYLYMNCCIEDAKFCKARLRTIEMANDMPLILASYNEYVQARQRQSIIFISVLSALLLILLALLVWLVSTRHQLSATLTQLTASNKELTLANRIRSTYVTQYMDECSKIIEHLSVYHQQLRKLAVKNNTDELFKLLKNDDFINDNLTDFYHHFDETFLGLFPHFIENFNALLMPGERFQAYKNHHGFELSTPLRIYALIRIGITNSEDIARFLRVSTKTVFNYRAAIRNRALGDRNELEQKIATIM